MKNVKFPVVEALGMIVYPDATEKFQSIKVRDGFVYAAYSGQLNLTEAAPPYDGSWHITKLAFRSRFTKAEKTAIEMVAAGSGATAAGLRADLADQRDAMYIDLKRADTIAGVQQLEAPTLLAAGRAAVILETPPNDVEVYRG